VLPEGIFPPAHEKHQGAGAKRIEILRLVPAPFCTAG